MIDGLVQNAMQIDRGGDFKDFKKRKAYATYDPYNTESQFAALRYESDIKLRASIVMESQHKVLDDIDYEGLNPRDRELHDQVNLLLNRLHDIKIIDAPILLKLYGLYRYRLHDTTPEE